MIQEITDSNFETLVLKNSKVAVLDFMAPWCGPCRMVSPLIETMAKEYEGQAIIGKVNVDTNPKLALQFKVRSMPTILYVKNGEVMDRHVGTTSKVVLEEKLKAIL